MTDRPESIRIRCSEETKNTWQAFCAGYDNNEDALRALLEEYANDAKRVRSVTFDL